MVKVEIKPTETGKEPFAVIYTNEITPEIRRAAELLEHESPGIIPVLANGRIVVLRPDEIYMVRVESEKTWVYTKSGRYVGGKRLYEFEALLGSGFMRISKAAIIHLQYVDSIEPTFGGLMLLILKNGCKEYISRKYLPAFKKHLGL